MSYVEIGVSDLGRSEEFYGELLGLGPGSDADDAGDAGDPEGRRARWLGCADHGRVKLVEVGPGGRASGWDRNDLQRGIRHFGLKVRGVDAWIDRLKAAGVEVAAGPFDAFGGVRIAFFFDPDGAYLEFVEGHVQHNELWSAELAQAEVDAYEGWDGTPRFDHVAVTVPDLEEALGYYRDRLDFGVVGQLVRPEDPRGFLITNLRGGSGTLEVFTYAPPTYPRESVGGPDRLGIRAVGVGVGDSVEPGAAVGPGDVPLHLTSVSATTGQGAA